MEGMKLTLIAVRTPMAMAKTAGAGVMLVALLKVFNTSMAVSSRPLLLSCFFGGLDLSVMVERQGSGEVVVLGKGCLEDSEG